VLEHRLREDERADEREDRGGAERSEDVVDRGDTEEDRDSDAEQAADGNRDRLADPQRDDAEQHRPEHLLLAGDVDG
jgi:hypothetical protein